LRPPVITILTRFSGNLVGKSILIRVCGWRWVLIKGSDHQSLLRLWRFGNANTFRDSIHTVTHEKNTTNHKYHGSCHRGTPMA
jgi:hypothetical protein